MNIAVVGYGRFGRLIAHSLRKHARVGVVDRRTRLSLGAGIERLTLAEAAGRELILLAVPVRSLQALLAAMAPSLAPGTVVADVCAVKEEPMRWMRATLPPGVSFLGTHPLFGPHTAGRGVAGNSIVLCPGRISAGSLQAVRRLFSRLGLTSHIMTPSAHDRQVASALFLTQLLGRSVRRIFPAQAAAATPNMLSLRRIIDSSASDSRELFEDLLRYNRHARAIPGRLRAELRRTLARPPRR